MKRKLLSVLLALTMILSLLPVSALATDEAAADAVPAAAESAEPEAEDITEEEEETEVPAEPEAAPVDVEDVEEPAELAEGEDNSENETALPDAVDGVITLSEDTTLSEAWTVSEDTTLDLAGHTLTCSGQTTVKATLTIQDSGTDGGGKFITSSSDDSAKWGIVVGSAGTLNVKGGTISNSSTTTNSVIAGAGTINIEGGTVTSGGATATIYGYGTLKISSGKVEITNVKRPAIYVTDSGSTVDISGGEITGGIDALVLADSASGTITGGTLTSDTTSGEAAVYIKTNASLEVSGGTLEGKDFGISGNGGSGLGGTNIKIFGNASVKGGVAGIYHPQSGSITVSGSATITGVTAIELKSGSLDISGTPTIKATDEVSHTPNSSGNSTNGYAVAAVYNSAYSGGVKVTIEGGNYTGDVAELSDADKTKDYTNIDEVELTITGGTFSSDPSKVTTTDEDGNETTTLTGYVADNYVARANEDGTYTVEELKSLAANTETVKDESGTVTASATIEGIYLNSESVSAGTGTDDETTSGEENVSAGDKNEIVVSATTGKDENGNDVANENVTTSEIKITGSVLSSINETNVVSTVTVQTDVGDLSIDSGAWDTITTNATENGETSSVKLSFSVTGSDKTTDEEGNETTDATSGRVKIELTAKDENGKSLYKEGESNGAITVKIPYKFAATESMPAPYVYYTSGASGRVLLNNDEDTYKVEYTAPASEATDAIGTLSWKAPHFSTYEVELQTVDPVIVGDVYFASGDEVSKAIQNTSKDLLKNEDENGNSLSKTFQPTVEETNGVLYFFLNGVTTDMDVYARMTYVDDATGKIKDVLVDAYKAEPEGETEGTEGTEEEENTPALSKVNTDEASEDGSDSILYYINLSGDEIKALSDAAEELYTITVYSVSTSGNDDSETAEVLEVSERPTDIPSDDYPLTFIGSKSITLYNNDSAYDEWTKIQTALANPDPATGTSLETNDGATAYNYSETKNDVTTGTKVYEALDSIMTAVELNADGTVKDSKQEELYNLYKNLFAENGALYVKIPSAEDASAEEYDESTVWTDDEATANAWAEALKNAKAALIEALQADLLETDNAKDLPAYDGLKSVTINTNDTADNTSDDTVVKMPAADFTSAKNAINNMSAEAGLTTGEVDENGDAVADPAHIVNALAAYEEAFNNRYDANAVLIDTVTFDLANQTLTVKLTKKADDTYRLVLAAKKDETTVSVEEDDFTANGFVAQNSTEGTITINEDQAKQLSKGTYTVSLYKGATATENEDAVSTKDIELAKVELSSSSTAAMNITGATKTVEAFVVELTKEGQTISVDLKAKSDTTDTTAKTLLVNAKQGETDVELNSEDGETYTFVMPAGDVTITATSEVAYKVTLSVPEGYTVAMTNSVGTTVNSGDSVAKGEKITFTVEIPEGEAMTLTARTSTGSGGYSDDPIQGTKNEDGTTTYTYTVEKAVDFTAKFEAATYDVSLNAKSSANATVKVGETTLTEAVKGVATYGKDLVLNVTLKDTTDTTSKVSKVAYTVGAGDDAVTGEATKNEDGTYTIEAAKVTDNIEVTVTVVKAYTVTFVVTGQDTGAGATVKVDGAAIEGNTAEATVDADSKTNAKLTFTVEPDNGYTVSTVTSKTDSAAATETGTLVNPTADADNAYELQNVTEATTVTITVTKNAYTVAIGEETTDEEGNTSLKEASSVREGDSVTLTAKLTNENDDEITNPTLTWASSDDEVATVKDGVVTGVKAGDVTITATYTTKAGAKYDSNSYAVTVTPVYTVSLGTDSSADATVTIGDEELTDDVTVDAGEDLIFNVVATGENVVVSVSAAVGEGEATELTANEDGSYTIEKVSGDVVITVATAVKTYDATITVADEDGEAISEAAVTVNEETATENTDEDGNGTGTYSVKLPAGEYTVTVKADGYDDGTDTLTVSADGDNTVAITLSEKTYDATITVNTGEEGSETAVSGATVTVNGETATEDTETDGTYNVKLVAGTYTVTVSATGYENNTGTLTVAADGENTVTITLTAASGNIVSIAAPDAITVEYGTEEAALNLPKTVTATLDDENETETPISVTWECEEYDGDTAGVYTFTGTLGTLPENVTNTNEVACPDLTVTVKAKTYTATFEVVDADGNAIEDATIEVTYDVEGTATKVDPDADGNYVLTEGVTYSYTVTSGELSKSGTIDETKVVDGKITIDVALTAEEPEPETVAPDVTISLSNSTTKLFATEESEGFAPADLYDTDAVTIKVDDNDATKYIATGTLKNITDWVGFNQTNEAEQSGYYLPILFTKEAIAEGKTGAELKSVTVTYAQDDNEDVNAEGNTYTTFFTEEDGSQETFIVRVADSDKEPAFNGIITVTFAFDDGTDAGVEKTYTIDCSGLEYATEVEPETTYTATFDVKDADGNAIDDANIVVTYDVEGTATKVDPEADGSYVLTKGVEYSYTVTKDGYQTTTSTIDEPAEGETSVTVPVTLTAEEPEPETVAPDVTISLYDGTEEVWGKDLTTLYVDGAEIKVDETSEVEGIDGVYTASGTLNLVKDWTEFSSNEAEQSGYYLPILFTKGAVADGETETEAELKSVTVKYAQDDNEDVNAEGNTYTTFFTEEDGSQETFIVRVADIDGEPAFKGTITVTFTFDNNETKTYTIDCSGLEYAPETEPETTYTATFEVVDADGNAIDDATIEVTYVEGEETKTVTPVEGVYTLTSGVEYSYTVTKDGYQVATGKVEEPEEGETSVTVPVTLTAEEEPEPTTYTITDLAPNDDGVYTATIESSTGTVESGMLLVYRYKYGTEGAFAYAGGTAAVQTDENGETNAFFYNESADGSEPVEVMVWLFDASTSKEINAGNIKTALNLTFVATKSTDSSN